MPESRSCSLARSGVQVVASLPETLSIVTYLRAVALYHLGKKSLVEVDLTAPPALGRYCNPAGRVKVSTGLLVRAALMKPFQNGAAMSAACEVMGLLSLLPA